MHKAEHVFGLHAVRGVLQRNPERVSCLMVLATRQDGRIEEVLQLAAAANVPVRRVARRELDEQVPGVSHQGVVALLGSVPNPVEGDLPQLLEQLDGPPFILILDGVQDPHNLGACLRSADAAGVGLVILSKDRSAPLTPAARRAASGAAEVLPILLATNLARVLQRLKERGIWLAGTTDHAESILYELDLTGPLALVMGSEGRGMRRLTTELCDYRLRIPMTGTVSSLNVSVATAICLFEIRRQRGAP